MIATALSGLSPRDVQTMFKKPVKPVPSHTAQCDLCYRVEWLMGSTCARCRASVSVTWYEPEKTEQASRTCTPVPILPHL
jgi:hypothetical protein